MAYEIEITREMKERFQSEAVSLLNRFEKMLLTLEKDKTDTDAVHAAFRAVHSIKGNSDYLGIADINTLAHELEDLMDSLRNGSLPVLKPVLNVLFTGLDLLRAMNMRVTDTVYVSHDLTDINHQINKIKSLSREGGPPEKSRFDAPLDTMQVFVRSGTQHIAQLRELIGTIVGNSASKEVHGAISRIVTTFLTAANYLKQSHLSMLLEKMVRDVDMGNDNVLDSSCAESLLDEIDALEQALARCQSPCSSGEKAVEETALTKAPVPGTGAREEVFADLLSREMKISLDHVDRFMNQVSRLAMVKTRLTGIVQSIPLEQHNTPWIKELSAAAAAMEKISHKLQTGVMDLRLLKMDTLFERLQRITRNLAQAGDKEINLVLSGGEVEVDRKVIEQLIDPLIHLLRNASDHGIESREKRMASHKDPVGTIDVSAVQEGSHVTVTVTDDGPGLDENEILRVALEKELITEKEMESLSRDAVLNLIFQPGFTTVKTVTPVSGRGVGLDAVAHDIKQIGGNTAFLSRPGKGSTVKLTVPVSLSVTEMLLCEAAGEVYAFPVAAVMETVQVKKDLVRSVNNCPVIPWRGDVIPVTPLADALDARADTWQGGTKIPGVFTLVITVFGHRAKGIAVDRIMGKEGVLIKPLAHHLADIAQFSSAALLGDGSIALTLDPSGL
ncbi:two-component system, chemotaxis family, sensor kinase CheA [Desulfocicer vacuolatum DSM 3385]|uniref:Chemotaxis protein CheA n=1 Tax=Desulfocicer vacuolatum DSM 3385 TaxID=1121400 RepID=A0A1W2BE43_9BACT|nr:chemotaxis protein CheA [Desulfocicer vacuolatum]SMC71245.1 two-component system, chemotaxis family, sensor kinase CheA [Desulfocicer vacuolatum DSM 3385]